ncbi:helix-turn-helix transcriptional regulator [Ensifer adhaerens]|uniref:winged helix-turn-helix transcriptional regulator n=1 Tax=Ensifer adhaerens TaxID=106592 RepID=UPI001CBBD50A|nr:helix-turn-helix domain-containing protein [Ensifer adhaerens]MBZ7920861.1 helix-turn-helix transcriptional regulator [Ensifer adhaerens]UAX93313.1 helix-turn-helix transcriptional regulator [Ensifer adhaerens]UAY00950.1 helix-turn-helix transcriptional regulator [Ensifer adhaerens]UAY08331.1 helix-turn-helix transcriptional regulator [Ensifer adhaerens]
MSLKVRKNRAAALPPTCPVGECMVLLGGAWTPNILWSLSAGPRRFSELRIDVPGISAKVLSTRLKELEEKGAIDRRIVPTSPPSVEYSLSELGLEFIPAIHAIVEVGHRLKQRREAERLRSEVAHGNAVPAAVAGV